MCMKIYSFCMEVSGCHGVWTCRGQWPVDWAGGWVGFMVHLDCCCSEPRDTDDLFLPQTLFPLCIRSSFSVLSLACSCSSSCGIPLASMFTFSSPLLTQFYSCFPTLPVISWMAPKLIFPAYSYSVTLDPNPQIF